MRGWHPVKFVAKAGPHWLTVWPAADGFMAAAECSCGDFVRHFRRTSNAKHAAWRHGQKAHKARKKR